MRGCSAILVAAALVFATAADGPAAKWWMHVRYLADDGLRGRETGSAGHRLAAEYVAGQLSAVGLKPAGSQGFFQPVLFKQRRIDEAHSRLTIVRAGGTAELLILGDDATIGLRNEPAAKVEAPIVFAGYGLQIPEAKYDDLAGLSVKNK